MQNILFRVDSSSEIGIGHLMRCLTLAKQYKNSEIIFSSQDLPGNLNKKIEEEGFILKVLKNNTTKELVKTIKSLNVGLLIIDSYKIDFAFEKQIKEETNVKILCFDDTYENHCADIILNHGLQADRNKYNSNAKILAGIPYTLIRDEFYKVEKNISNQKIKHILIILGGADVKNYSFQLAKSLKKINSSFNITIATTSSNKNLNKLILKKKYLHYTLEIDAGNIASIMSKNDLIITSTSSTLYEVIFLKKLFINITMANNQIPLEQYLEKNKLSFNLSNFKSWVLRRLLINIEYNQKIIYRKLRKFDFSRYRLINEIKMEIDR